MNRSAPLLRRTLLSIAVSFVLTPGVWAADGDGLATTSGFLTATIEQQGLIIQSTDPSESASVRAFGDAGSIAVLDGSAGTLYLSDGLGGSTTIGTTSSNIGGDMTVGDRLIISNTNNIGGAALQVTGDTSLTGNVTATGNASVGGTLSVTGETTLNSGGTNQVVVDATSARLVSGAGSVAVGAGGASVFASGAQNDPVQASVLVQNTTSGNTHGLIVGTTETTLSGGATSTTVTLSDAGMRVSDSTNGDTFAVSNAGVARLGNDALAGSLSISNGTPGGNHTVLNGVTNSISGSTSTTVTGGTATLTLNNNASLVGTTTASVSGGGTTLTLNASGASLGGAQLHNVAAGTAGTDAVNVNQLNSAVGSVAADVVAVDNRVTEVNRRVNHLNNRVDDLRDRSYGGIASVAALAAVPAPPPGKRFTIGAGVGHYSGENAIAVGFRGAVSDAVSVTLGVSHNSSGTTASNAGVGFSW